MDTPSYVKKTPLKSIGARDILKLDYEKCGHLRKEGGIERSVLSKFVKWRQFFIVLRDGCCYIFDNDHSTNPKTAFSFENYCRLECFTKPPDMEYCFKVIPKAECNELKEHCFASSDDTSKQDWVLAIYKALHVANNLPIPNVLGKGAWKEDIFKRNDSSLHGYTYIDEVEEDSAQVTRRRYTQMPIKSPLTRVKSLPPLPIPKESLSTADSDSPTDSYDDILSQSFTENARISRSASEYRKCRPPPSPPTEEIDTVSEQLFYANLESEVADLPLFLGDSSEAKRSIKDEAVGTFLIRKSSTGGDKSNFVLVVSAPSGELQYRIYKKDEAEIYIVDGIFFKRLSELVEHYRKNDLPCNRRLTKHHGHMNL
ncbi:uncharacterized protein LOC125657983 [Ostrea edulis]|uniref:uncharacterized protein LOC125657983 n=1 Tax=Ostrea edulis TaxID=37623 RepID=UPI0024AE9F1A|nr:uncharacterized protein LOC125657983 [Ostrea edulis]XP_048744930.2 uncharacterized protein LOC125657983 [Ostrea edulis]XP_048744931.2 uncharacterized protein LOC125657983 [Ostrea edulis]XP_048744932.2 uncharacterized protein LOC125657983 [Ostrea edulis]XP_048744933.2 uncharacterized protein LOC125657983 [Ostrea edulis]